MHSSFLTTFLPISFPPIDHLLSIKMIKMSYPESITLLALNQFHLLASNIITMAQEPAAAAPLMTATQIAHQNRLDKAIRRNNCTFLFRICLLPYLRDILIINLEGVYPIPSTNGINELPRFSAFLTDDIKPFCHGGRQIRCVSFEPYGHYTRTIVQGNANGTYDFTVPWRAMVQRCGLEETAVLSMWGFYEDGMPRFIFRHDGYADRGEELPPLTDMTVVDPEPGQDDLIINQQPGQGGRCNCCNVG